METINNIVEIVIICLCIAVFIGIALVIFLAFWTWQIDKTCSPTDAEEERECAKWEHWSEAEK